MAVLLEADVLRIILDELGPSLGQLPLRGRKRWSREAAKTRHLQNAASPRGSTGASSAAQAAAHTPGCGEDPKPMVGGGGEIGAYSLLGQRRAMAGAPTFDAERTNHSEGAAEASPGCGVPQCHAKGAGTDAFAGR